MQGLGSQGAPTALRVAGLTGGPADTDKRRKQPTAARHLVHGGSAKQPAGPVAVPCPDTLKHQLEDVLTVLSSSSLKLILLGKEQAGSGWLSAPEEVRRLSQACPPQSLPSTRPDDHSACWGCCGVVLQITVQLDTVTFVQVTSPTTRPASPPEALMLAATQPNPAVNPGPVHSLSSSGAAGAAAGVNQTGGMAQPVVYPPVYQEDQIVSCPRCATRFKSPQACHSLICPECMLPIEENAGAGAQSPQLQPQQPPPQQPQQPPPPQYMQQQSRIQQQMQQMQQLQQMQQQQLQHGQLLQLQQQPELLLQPKLEAKIEEGVVRGGGADMSFLLNADQQLPGGGGGLSGGMSGRGGLSRLGGGVSGGGLSRGFPGGFSGGGYRPVSE